MLGKWLLLIRSAVSTSQVRYVQFLATVFRMLELKGTLAPSSFGRSRRTTCVVLRSSPRPNLRITDY